MYSATHEQLASTWVYMCEWHILYLQSLGSLRIWVKNTLTCKVQVTQVCTYELVYSCICALCACGQCASATRVRVRVLVCACLCVHVCVLMCVHLNTWVWHACNSCVHSSSSWAALYGTTYWPSLTWPDPIPHGGKGSGTFRHVLPKMLISIISTGKTYAFLP